MAITRALADTTLAGAGQKKLVYDVGSNSILGVEWTDAALHSNGYQLDHFFERQFISGLFFVEINGKDPGIRILDDLLSLANLNKNLIWVQKDLHAVKSKFFTTPSTTMSDGLRNYLIQGRAKFAEGLDNFGHAHPLILELIGSIKHTPFYIGQWEGIPNGQSWFRA
ncbi:MAG: hypothetical protein M1825_000853 [Sarcosagium campestre]|nr:MAG: hypothetical protein M1825_000853 [Sarcosagium campestre]